MKKYIHITLLALSSLLFAPAVQAVDEINVSFSGALTEEDRQAALLIVTTENERRAALEVPETLLPVATPTELRQSATEVLKMRMAEVWVSYLAQAEDQDLEELRTLWKESSREKREAAKAELEKAAP